MGLTVAELVATLGADASDFDQGLDGLLGKFGPIGGAATAAAAVAVAAIAAIGVAVIHYGGQFDEAFDSIRIGTGATGKALAGLEDDFKAVVSSVPTDFASASSAITELNRRLGLTGEPLQTLSEQFLELSRLTGSDVAENVRLGTRLFGDWSIAAKDQSGALDMLFRATQQSGIGMGDLMQTVVEFGAPLRNMGFGFTDSIAMLAKWETRGREHGHRAHRHEVRAQDLRQGGPRPAERAPEVHREDQGGEVGDGRHGDRRRGLRPARRARHGRRHPRGALRVLGLRQGDRRRQGHHRQGRRRHRRLARVAHPAQEQGPGRARAGPLGCLRRPLESGRRRRQGAHQRQGQEHLRRHRRCLRRGPGQARRGVAGHRSHRHAGAARVGADDADLHAPHHAHRRRLSFGPSCRS